MLDYRRAAQVVRHGKTTRQRSSRHKAANHCICRHDADTAGTDVSGHQHNTNTNLWRSKIRPLGRLRGLYQRRGTASNIAKDLERSGALKDRIYYPKLAAEDKSASEKQRMGIAAFCNGILNSNLLRKNLSKAQGIKNPWRRRRRRWQRSGWRCARWGLIEGQALLLGRKMVRINMLQD